MSKLELKIPPVVLVVITFLLMWGASLVTPSVGFLKHANLPLFIVFACLGALFSILGVLSFRKANTTVNPTMPSTSSSLVTTGVYRNTRNPMYVGFLLFLVGWALWLSNLYSLGLSLFFVFYMNRFQIRPEERALDVIFGAEFLEYKQKVRRWL